jgi:hypothetical protein
MTQPDSQDWEDIIPGGAAQRGPQQGRERCAEKAGPFAGARPVDGYAFTDHPESPELRYRPQSRSEVPVPPRREPPSRIRDQVPITGLWQPGGSARTGQPQVRMPRPNVVRALLRGLVPLGVLAGGIYLVMRLYGFQ